MKGLFRDFTVLETHGWALMIHRKMGYIKKSTNISKKVAIVISDYG